MLPMPHMPVDHCMVTCLPFRCRDLQTLCEQGPDQAGSQLCLQLQLAPAAAGLVRGLTSIPIEAEERSLSIPPPPGILMSWEA